MLRSRKKSHRFCAKVAWFTIATFIAGMAAQPLAAAGSGRPAAARRAAAQGPAARASSAKPAKPSRRARRVDPEAARSRPLSRAEMAAMEGGCCGGVYTTNEDLGEPCNCEMPAGPFGDPAAGGCGGDESCLWEGSGADSVNLLNGNECYAPGPDVEARGTRGDPVAFSRCYNNRDMRIGPFGKGWTHNWNLYLTFPPVPPEQAPEVQVSWGDGHDSTYRQAVDEFGNLIPGEFVGPLAESAVLTQDETGAFRVSLPSGETHAFNAQGTLLACDDANGNTIACAYTNGLLTGLTDASGRTTQVTWNAAGDRIAAVTDPTGRQVIYTYDEAGCLAGVNCWDGRWVQYTVGWYLYSVHTERGTLSLGYDQGRAAYHTNEEGKQWRLWWIDGNTTDRYVPRLGGGEDTWRHYYGGNGWSTQTVAPGGGSVSRAYDERGNLIAVTGPAGDTASFQYDLSNNLTLATDPEGYATQYTYTPDGDVETITDPDYNVTTFEYDGNRNLIAVTDPLLRTTTFAYDGFGQVTGVTSPGWLTTGCTYDALGNVESETGPDAQTTQHTYDVHGNRLTTRLPNGKTVTFSYDGSDRPTQVLYPDNTTRQYTYGCCGVATATDQRGKVTQYQYTPLGQTRSVQDPAGRTVQLYYTPLGQLWRVIDGNGNEHRYEYDARQRLLNVSLAYPTAAFPQNPGRRLQYAYGLASEPGSRLDANGNRIYYEYNQRRLPTRKRYPDTSAVAYDYDGHGRLTAMRNEPAPGLTEAETGPGITTGPTPWVAQAFPECSGGAELYTGGSNADTWVEFAFTGSNVDVLYTQGIVGSRAWVSVDGQNVGILDFFVGEGCGGPYYQVPYHVGGLAYGPHTVRVTWMENHETWDPVTQMWALIPPGMFVDAFRVVQDYPDPEQTSYEYDGAGQLTAITEPGGRRMAYTYNADGQPDTVADYDGGVTSYTYDTAGRPSWMTNPADETTTWDYDVLGRVTRQALGNGTYSDYTYHPDRGWLTRVANKNSLDTVLSSFDYLYDEAGNRTRVDHADGSYLTYGYDDAYQLISETRVPNQGPTQQTSWTYDAAGNRLTQVRNGVTTNYTYDSDNRLLTAGNRSFSYDNNGSLTSETEDGTTVTYAYDWDNRLKQTSDGEQFRYRQDGLRVRRTVGGVETRFLYDGADVWGETDAAGTTQTVYTRGLLGLVSQRTGGVSSFYGFDALGSAVQVTDAAEQVLSLWPTYEAFGGGHTTVPTPYRFVGELGYYGDTDHRHLLTHRYYRSDLGRFMTPDPIGDAGGLNLYRYAAGDPVSYVDPDGENPVLLVVGLLALKFFLDSEKPAGREAPGQTPYKITSHPFFPDPNPLGKLKRAPLLAQAAAVAARKGGKLVGGQLHHVLSNKIMRALGQHKTLAGKFCREDARFKVRAASKAAHNGYDGWARSVDDDILTWLGKNPTATEGQFLKKLREVYSKPGATVRFPGYKVP